MAALLCTLAGTVFDRTLGISPDPLSRAGQGGAVQIANVFAIAGLVFLALGMTAVVFLVTDLLFKPAVTAVVTGLTAALFAAVWFALPLLRKAAD